MRCRTSSALVSARRPPASSKISACIDAAIDQYAIENNKKQDDPVTITDVKNYLKAGTVLYSDPNKDLLGNSFGAPWKVDSIPKVDAATYAALSDVAPASFWSPFK